jgi:hypothetical protein
VIKTKGIKCNLYSISYAEGKIKPNKLYSTVIIGKNLFISTLQDGYESNNREFYNEYSFDYLYNVPFDSKISISKKKTRKLNVKITYPITDANNISTQVCYTYFSYCNKIINSLHFNKLWIQQPMNIMWIINILVIILLGLATLCL